MARNVTISPRRLAVILQGLEKPTKILQRIGALLVAAGQRAFAEQKFGNVKWPERYPNQSDPFVHIAGAVQDLAEGGDPKPQRFFVRGRPLRGTGLLFNSIKDESKAVRVGNFEVTYGSNLPYASLHNSGGISTQTITEDMRTRFAKFLDRLETKGSKGGRGRPKAQAMRAAAEDKLGFLFHENQLRTHVNKRPFVGMYPKLAQQITDTVEQTLTEGV